MRRRLRRTDVLPAAQGLCLAALAWPGGARWTLPAPAVGGALALVLAGAALVEEGVRFLGRDLTPFVDPVDGARLRTDGPFEISRNPVYAGLLLAGTGVAVLRRRPEPLAALVGLSAVLHVKAMVEEDRLRERFGARYDAYARRTPRLLGLPTPRAV